MKGNIMSQYYDKYELDDFYQEKLNQAFNEIFNNTEINEKLFISGNQRLKKDLESYTQSQNVAKLLKDNGFNYLESLNISELQKKLNNFFMIIEIWERYRNLIDSRNGYSITNKETMYELVNPQLATMTKKFLYDIYNLPTNSLSVSGVPENFYKCLRKIYGESVSTLNSSSNDISPKKFIDDSRWIRDIVKAELPNLIKLTNTPSAYTSKKDFAKKIQHYNDYLNIVIASLNYWENIN